ncbi:PREDICTED: uncharacterized protein LOC105364673 [Ceratosolen solmsi marchali]|uniref:Uncharacterized protein LOC105364673 n=1 Tax=Ceratosolen solmsi marchali TaxID=326594 RepID=A0AAJ6YMU8_9HYME|nr:PREDICTED: uncharacterized protein LOC105364673 [Ceratosolen solmsi marchali]
MSTQCRHFVQNAWKKELCSNCFKAREDHANNQETLRPVVARTANSVKRVAHKVQGILRPKESNSLCNVQQQVRSKRKNVAFPDSLAEIIGYDGGDDFASDEESGYTVDDPDSLNGDTSLEVDELPDSEEERALGNLTRANTNFNTVTANLSSPPEEPKTPAKSFSSLMLGRAQKDGDGRKTTLLVSVKPFGGDDSLPTARRPSDKKSLDITKPKVSSETLDVKVELSIIKPMKKPINEKPLHVTNKSLTSTTTASLGKIVDMPLITSTNLITVMRDESAHKALESPKKTPSAATMITATGITEQRRVTSIARTPAIKKSENEKPRIMAQPSADHNAARNHKNLEMSNGVELSLSPIVVTGDRSDGSSTNFAKLPQEIPSYKSTSRMSDLMERRVEGEAAHEKYTFEVSRESAGEPDGKADEELVAEPSKERQRLAEPRASFLHGTSSEPRPKPSVPLKPIGSSLASILSESRAYEFRVGQKTNGGLAHARSDSHLCDSERLANAKPGQLQLAGRQVERAAAVESSGQLNDSDATPKSSCPRSSTERDEQLLWYIVERDEFTRLWVKGAKVEDFTQIMYHQ